MVNVSNDRRSGLPAPQFGLGFLFFVVGLFGAIFAATRYFGPYGGFASMLCLLCVAAHVVGNAWGTQLRRSGSLPVDENGNPLPPDGHPTRPLLEHDFAPITRLGRRHSLGVVATIATLSGILAGVIFAIYFFFTSNLRDATWADFAIAILGFGILGGVWTFLGTSFLYVTWGALRQATHETPK